MARCKIQLFYNAQELLLKQKKNIKLKRQLLFKNRNILYQNKLK